LYLLCCEEEPSEESLVLVKPRAMLDWIDLVIHVCLPNKHQIIMQKCKLCLTACRNVFRRSSTRNEFVSDTKTWATNFFSSSSIITSAKTNTQIYCAINFIYWVFNFVSFVGRALYKYQIPAEFFYNLFSFL